jgi:phage-related minor tail protein
LVVQQLVGSLGGGGILGTIGKAFPALQGSASGGALMAGQPSVVGEHGRELFVPSTSGRVLSVPQAKAAVNGGGGVTVVQNINVSTGVQQTVRAEIKSLMPQIADSAKAAVFDAQRRSVNGMGFA